MSIKTKHSDSSWEKIGYKWKDDLNDDLTWWVSGILHQGCVSHSDSIPKLWWVVSEMFIKSSEGWNLMRWVMILPNQSWCSISFVPHYSFHCALLCTHISLTSPFPVTNIASFWTIEQVWKDVPTRVISKSLLGQAVIRHLESWGLSLDHDLELQTQILCCPPSKWSNNGLDPLPLPWQIVFPSLLPWCPLPNEMVFGL